MLRKLLLLLPLAAVPAPVQPHTLDLEPLCLHRSRMCTRRPHGAAPSAKSCSSSAAPSKFRSLRSVHDASRICHTHMPALHRAPFEKAASSQSAVPITQPDKAPAAEQADLTHIALAMLCATCILRMLSLPSNSLLLGCRVPTQVLRCLKADTKVRISAV